MDLLHKTSRPFVGGLSLQILALGVSDHRPPLRAARIAIVIVIHNQPNSLNRHRGGKYSMVFKSVKQKLPLSPKAL
jgi:hypothetical protein